MFMFSLGELATGIVGRRRPTATVAMALLLILVTGAAGAEPAQAQTNFKVLYTFKGPVASDGQTPRGTLIFDAAGNLYGTTEYGGTVGYGTVYKLDPTGRETAPPITGRYSR